MKVRFMKLWLSMENPVSVILRCLQRFIAETLMMFMRVRGGDHSAMNSSFVYGPLADFYDLSDDVRRLSTSDYCLGEFKPGLAWNSEVDSAFKTLKKDGYVLSTTASGKSVWRLTPNGVERADFWLKRMTDKTSALRSLKVDAGLAWLETADQPKKLQLS